jgi:hypothetical protein
MSVSLCGLPLRTVAERGDGVRRNESAVSEVEREAVLLVRLSSILSAADVVRLTALLGASGNDDRSMVHLAAVTGVVQRYEDDGEGVGGRSKLAHLATVFSRPPEGRGAMSLPTARSTIFAMFGRVRRARMGPNAGPYARIISRVVSNDSLTLQEPHMTNVCSHCFLQLLQSLCEYVFDKNVLDNTPLAQRLLFKMGGTVGAFVFCHESIAGIFRRETPSGARLVLASEY